MFQLKHETEIIINGIPNSPNNIPPDKPPAAPDSSGSFWVWFPPRDPRSRPPPADP